MVINQSEILYNILQYGEQNFKIQSGELFIFCIREINLVSMQHDNFVFYILFFTNILYNLKCG